MVQLTTLLPNAQTDLDITGLALDSRKVEPGFLFAALPGQNVDGRDFISKAIDAGAKAILVPSGSDIKENDVTIIEDENPREAFALACARFFDRQPELCAAVTGTNGKSSCVTFIRELWSLLGEKAASVGTLGISAPDLEIGGGLTTPDSVGLHQNLALLFDHGVTHMAMEASSHGLDQYRLDGVQVDIAAFTNFTRDHLDYHPDMDAYFEAKSRLFSAVLKDSGTAVLNADIKEYAPLKSICDQRNIRVISFGEKGETICLKSCEIKGHVQSLRLEIEGEIFDIDLPLAGAFQIENALCSLGVVMASGFKAKDCAPLLSKLSGVPGRMEHLGANVYVDYAHTPDALETVLKSLRPHTEKELIVVFGCGGDRDAGKRPQMGKIAKEFADQIVVTDDNPRSENPDQIRKEIMTACPDALEIGDRRSAIERALSKMTSGDAVLLAGKGHETGQIVGDQVLPFDDRLIAKEILQERAML